MKRQTQQGQSGRPERPKANFGALKRALSYLGHYRKIMVVAYGALFVATLAQLAVPSLVRSIIDSVTNGVIASKLTQVPAQFLSAALKQIGWTPEQFVTTLHTGVDPSGHALDDKQMPWPFIGRLDDDELAALYAYLNNLP